MQTTQFGFQGRVTYKVKKSAYLHGQKADAQRIPADM